MDKTTVGLIMLLVGFFVGFLVGLPIRKEEKETIRQAKVSQEEAEKVAWAHSTELRKLQAERAEISEKLAQTRSNYEQSRIALRETVEKRNKANPKPSVETEQERRKKMLAKCLEKQKEFHWERRRFYNRYMNSLNEVAKSTVFREAGKYTADFFREQSNAIRNWEGRIESIDTPHGGETASLRITADLWDFEIEFLTDSRTKLRRDTALYNQLLKLPEGSRVIFSAEVISDDSEKGIREISWTEKGSLGNPEYIVEFTDIQPR